MQGRHSGIDDGYVPRAERPYAGRRLLALVAVAGLAVATVVAVRTVQAGAGGCNHAVNLKVAAPPEIAPVVRTIGDRWSATRPRVNDACVRVQVAAVQPADVANALAVRAGMPINVAAKPVPSPGDDDLPGLWIADSTAWMVRVRAINRGAVDDLVASVATSPVVLAVPEPSAATLTGPEPHPLSPAEVNALLQNVLKSESHVRFGFTEPRRDATGLASAIALRDAIAPNAAQLPALVAAYRTVTVSPDRTGVLKAFGADQTVASLSEQSVIAYDATNPSTPLVAVPLQQPSALDYPAAVITGKARAVTRAAEVFRQTLLASADDFTHAGYRAVDGTTGPGFPAGHGAVPGQVSAEPISDPARIADVLSVWTTSRAPSRVLALVDVTASAAQPIAPASAARIQVMQQAATGGLRLFTDDSEVGLWAFATGHRELVPLSTLTPEQRARLDGAAKAATPTGEPTRALYGAVLDAYKIMRDGYRDDRSNTIVVFTAGANTKPGESLDDMELELENLTDTTRPVRVILLGFGPEANLDELSAIAKTTGGKAFKVDNAAEIGSIFLQALVRSGT